MSDIRKKFHELALKSSLFKGRSDWYFCYLKSEKIAHVLLMLAQQNSDFNDLAMQDLTDKAVLLPQIIARFAAGQSSVEGVLADIFGLLTAVRFCTTRGLISRDNGYIIEGEYELLVEKISMGNVVSPFISSDDFSVPVNPDDNAFLNETPLLETGTGETFAPRIIKDKQKRHSKGQKDITDRQKERTSAILQMVRRNQGVSVSDIAAIIQDCSEKTIQRELASLIRLGMVRKKGERRWSLYYPT